MFCCEFSEIFKNTFPYTASPDHCFLKAWKIPLTLKRNGYTYLKLQLKAADLFKYLWPFMGNQALKGEICFMGKFLFSSLSVSFFSSFLPAKSDLKGAGLALCFRSSNPRCSTGFKIYRWTPVPDFFVNKVAGLSLDDFLWILRNF